ncbi:MAG: SDR family oxidoreductase [Flavobacterium sp.]
MSKVVFITGASSGIGLSIGNYLYHKGYQVFGTSRTPEKYPNSLFPLIALDVREELSIQKAFSELFTKAKSVDVVINNAGVGITGPLEEIPLSEIKSHFDTNLFGPIAVMQTVLPQLRAQGSGLIINITSIAGYMGLPFRSAYSASKGALELITEGIRMEVKPFGVDITNVAPGDFATNIAAGRYHAPLQEDSTYFKTYGHTLNMMNEHVDSGSDPDLMAKAIESIIEAQHPKVHYKVGNFLQRFSIVLKRILPDRMYEKMLMKHYGLGRE